MARVFLQQSTLVRQMEGELHHIIQLTGVVNVVGANPMAVQRTGPAELLVDAAGGAYPNLILKIRTSSQCVDVQVSSHGCGKAPLQIKDFLCLISY